MSNKYQNGKIYKLVRDGSLPYYGSTTQSLEKRYSQHIANFKNYRKGTIKYATSSDKVIQDFDYCIPIILVENYPCNSKKELLRREGYYHRNYPCVNKQVAGRTKIEYEEEKKEDKIQERVIRKEERRMMKQEDRLSNMNRKTIEWNKYINSEEYIQSFI